LGNFLGDFSLSLGDFLTETSGHPVYIINHSGFGSDVLIGFHKKLQIVSCVALAITLTSKLYIISQVDNSSGLYYKTITIVI